MYLKKKSYQWPLVFALFSVALVQTSCTTSKKKDLSPAEEATSEVLKGEADLSNLGIKLNVVQKSLPNGLTILMVEDHTVPVISYQTWFKVGSADEKPGYTGLAHLFEHLMFKGTEKYGPKEFLQQLEAKGAAVNAYTTRDYTVYHETFIPALLEKVMDMESDRLVNLKLDEDVLKTERQVVFEERRLRTDNSPAGKMQEALWALAYTRHPYHWPVIGYPEDLMRADVPKLKEFFKTHYQPGNATLVIVGDFDSNHTLQLIKKYYGNIPGRKPPARDIEEEPEQNEERRLTLYDQVASERLAIGYHATAASNDDSYALDVLANVLFAGTNSRAYQKLVEEMQIAGGVSGIAYTPTFPGLFMINASMRGNIPATEAEAQLDLLIRNVQEKEVTPQEIQIAVRQLTVQLVDSVRTSHGLGTLLGTVMMVFGDPDRFTSDLSKYLAVTPSDIKRVANKYLIPNNRSVVTLKPVAAKGASQ